MHRESATVADRRRGVRGARRRDVSGAGFARPPGRTCGTAGGCRAAATPAEPRCPRRSHAVAGEALAVGGGATSWPVGPRRWRRSRGVASGAMSSRGGASSRVRGTASSARGGVVAGEPFRRRGAMPSPWKPGRRLVGGAATATDTATATGTATGTAGGGPPQRGSSRSPGRRTATPGRRRRPARLADVWVLASACWSARAGPRGLCRRLRGAYAASSVCGRPADSPVARVPRGSAAAAQAPGRSGAASSRDRRRARAWRSGPSGERAPADEPG